MPVQLKEELQAKKAAYYLLHAESNKERARVYHEKHKDAINARIRAYRKANPEQMKADYQRRKIREAASGKINPKCRKPHVPCAVTCECGTVLDKTSMVKHLVSKKHAKLMAALESKPEENEPAPVPEVVQVVIPESE